VTSIYSGVPNTTSFDKRLEIAQRRSYRFRVTPTQTGDGSNQYTTVVDYENYVKHFYSLSILIYEQVP